MNFSVIVDGIPPLLNACVLTLLLSVLSFAVGQAIGLVVALGRVSRLKIVSTGCFIYTFVLRGSPLLVQLFIIYYSLAQIPAVRQSIFWPLLRDPFFCAVLAIGLNASAYMAELLRGAIVKVPRGQAEAATTLGLTRSQQFISVVLPQAYRAVLPALGNEMILTLKATSLASTITIMDITGVARTIAGETYAPFEIFATAGVLYLIIGYLATQVFRLLELRLAIPGMWAVK